MNSAVVVAVIGLVGSVVAGAITYWSTKLREREAEWRKEKLSYYKAFVESMSGIVEGDATPEGHRQFARATNNLLLFAPQGVVAAVNEFRHEIRISNASRSAARHDELLAKMLLAIRSDIGVSPTDEPSSFKPTLWASGARETNPSIERTSYRWLRQRQAAAHVER
jgi:hypothetical protein